MMPVPKQPRHVVKITCIPLSKFNRIPMRYKSIAQKHISISPCKYREWPYSESETVGEEAAPSSRSCDLPAAHAPLPSSPVIYAQFFPCFSHRRATCSLRAPNPSSTSCSREATGTS